MTRAEFLAPTGTSALTPSPTSSFRLRLRSHQAPLPTPVVGRSRHEPCHRRSSCLGDAVTEVVHLVTRVEINWARRACAGPAEDGRGRPRTAFNAECSMVGSAVGPSRGCTSSSIAAVQRAYGPDDLTLAQFCNSCPRHCRRSRATCFSRRRAVSTSSRSRAELAVSEEPAQQDADAGASAAARSRLSGACSAAVRWGMLPTTPSAPKNHVGSPLALALHRRPRPGAGVDGGHAFADADPGYDRIIAVSIRSPIFCSTCSVTEAGMRGRRSGSRRCHLTCRWSCRQRS
jgi:hypothetical protein